MSILALVQLDRTEFSQRDTPLRTPSQEVTDYGESFQRIVDDLLETFKSHKIAIGLAAPQVGVQLKLAVINIKEGKAEPTLIIVNPKILSTGGKKDLKKESCMSLPDYAGSVERRHKVTISYQDRFGEHATLAADGFLARVITHEIDHLEGFLYIDRMKAGSQLEKVDIFQND